jgi:hypothetical protein
MGVAKVRPSMRVVEGGGDRHQLPHQPDDEVLLRVHRGILLHKQLDAGGDEDGAEDIDGPVEALEEGGTGEDEDGPHDERAEDAPEEHPVLILGGDGEGGEDEDEYEDVVDRQRLLDEVARTELHGPLWSELPGNEAAKDGGEDDPDEAPAGGLLHGDLVRLFVEEAKVEREHGGDKGDEASPEGGGTDGVDGHESLRERGLGCRLQGFRRRAPVDMCEMQRSGAASCSAGAATCWQIAGVNDGCAMHDRCV